MGLCCLFNSMQNFLFKMKLLTFLIFVSVSSTTANSYSQNTKFTFNFENTTVSQVFHKIEEASEFIFIYSEASVDLNRKINVKVEDETIDLVLNQLFNGTKNYSEIHDRQIVILSSEIKGSQLMQSISEVEQPQKKEISGTVRDSKGLPVPGVAVVVKGSTIGIITDTDGQFKLSVPVDAKVLMFSFVGMKKQEFVIADQTSFSIVMLDEIVGLSEVVSVGYGTQKKTSVVGAITTTTSKELERMGGITNLAQALSGNLPGLTTIQMSGQPGYSDPKIYIRGQSTWNGGEPYILVDGVERRMNDLDVSEVDNISVLKDASATAVYGVKGANGVILITTRRGKVGKPVLSVSVNSTMKSPSRVIDKLDSYNTLSIKNKSIAREVVLNEAEWKDYTPLAIVERYRNQQSLKYPEAYPNVDWQKETIKSMAFDHHVNMNVSGGTDFVKYYSTLSYLHEGDLMKVLDIGKGYKATMGYDRFNFRTNLDVNISKNTLLKINLAGVYGVSQGTAGENTLYGAYGAPPNSYMPRYSDGLFGGNSSALANSVALMANSGMNLNKRTDLTTDFTLTQKLDFITRGLSIGGNLSFDNRFSSSSGIGGTDYQSKYILPTIEDMAPGENPNNYIIITPTLGTNQFGWVSSPWGLNSENASGSLSRRLFYQGQINYARTFGKHDVTAVGVFTREQMASGSEFQRFREDWIFRATYNYDSRYFAELNGAYNGSEKFSRSYRFGFFPSVAVGWTISNEKFMESLTWINKLKLRYSHGLIGDDGVSERWLYDSQWQYGSKSPMGEYAGSQGAYTWYSQSVIGNPDIHWEKAIKSNLGLELDVLKSMFSANVEYFTENRTDILLSGSSRVLPSYFGGKPPTANVGQVKKNGYEIELRFNKNVQDWHFWVNASMTHAVDKIIYKEEPALKDPHLLAQGFQIDQTKSYIRNGFLTSWDEVYAVTPAGSNNTNKLPGDYKIKDFDGNGVINYVDEVPFGYSTRPQNAYNFSFGADYKGFSCMLQFYGVNNVTRDFTFLNFLANYDIVYPHTLDHWTKDNPNGTSFLPRWKTNIQTVGDYYKYDGSYLRLRTVELAYTFSNASLKHSRLFSSLKVYLNGNNLLFWSKMVDDLEAGGGRYGAYPTARRINLGVDIKF